MEEIEKVVDNESLKWFSDNYIPRRMLLQTEKNGIYEVTDLISEITLKIKFFILKIVM